MGTGSSEDQDCGCPVHPVETFTPEDDERTNMKTTGIEKQRSGGGGGAGRGAGRGGPGRGSGPDRVPSSDVASELAPSRRKLADTEEESFETFAALDICLLLEMCTGEVMTCAEQWGAHPRKQGTQTPSKR